MSMDHGLGPGPQPSNLNKLAKPHPFLCRTCARTITAARDLDSSFLTLTTAVFSSLLLVSISLALLLMTRIPVLAQVPRTGAERPVNPSMWSNLNLQVDLHWQSATRHSAGTQSLPVLCGFSQFLRVPASVQGFAGSRMVLVIVRSFSILATALSVGVGWALFNVAPTLEVFDAAFFATILSFYLRADCKVRRP
jgi:hypothetical protein